VPEQFLIEGAPQTALEKGIEIGMIERLTAIAAQGSRCAHELRRVHGQRAGFICAENVDGAEGMDGGEILDDETAAGERQGSAGEIDVDDHWQQFRGETDDNCQGEKQGAGPVSLERAVDKKDKRSEHGDKAEEHPAYFFDTALEDGLGAVATQFIGNAAQPSAVSGGDDNADAGSLDDVGTHVT
jgi:hypothetical protein